MSCSRPRERRSSRPAPSRRAWYWSCENIDGLVSSTMQVPRYFTARNTWRLAGGGARGCASAAVRAQQAPAVPAAGESTLIVFLNGREVGREQVSLARTPSGWTITSSGALGGPVQPVDQTLRGHLRARLAADRAQDRRAPSESRPIALATSFGTTTAINEITQNGVTTYEDRSDHGTGRRPPQQLLRRLRSAGRTSLRYDAWRRAGGVCGAAGRDQADRPGRHPRHLSDAGRGR